MGDGFVPDNLDLSVVDGVVLASSGEAIPVARRGYSAAYPPGAAWRPASGWPGGGPT